MSKLGILHNEFSITYRRNFELKTFKITILVLFSAACEAQELLETFIALAEASAPPPKGGGFHPLGTQKPGALGTPALLRTPVTLGRNDSVVRDRVLNRHTIS
jgi:hypothetical protein